jgi:hypothetical protein
MYRATERFVTVGETPKSSEMGVRHGMMIAEPMGDAMAAQPIMKVMSHLVDLGYSYGSATSGTIAK